MTEYVILFAIVVCGQLAATYITNLIGDYKWWHIAYKQHPKPSDPVVVIGPKGRIYGASRNDTRSYVAPTVSPVSDDFLARQEAAMAENPFISPVGEEKVTAADYITEHQRRLRRKDGA